VSVEENATGKDWKENTEKWFLLVLQEKKKMVRLASASGKGGRALSFEHQGRGYSRQSERKN